MLDSQLPSPTVRASRMISALGELVRTDGIDSIGRLTGNGGRVQLDTEHDVYISENDISELAQAKGWWYGECLANRFAPHAQFAE